MRREWLVVERFAALLRALGRTGDAAALNRAYLDHLGEGSYLLPGAQALCRALAPRCTLAIVTNGVARAQRRRFEASPLNGLIPWLFISEELGASKPDSAFFAPVLRTLGNPDPRRVLMVGDNLLADIQGGIQAGLDTAWYNPGRLPGDPAIVPTWEVDGYAALQALILKEEKTIFNRGVPVAIPISAQTGAKQAAQAQSAASAGGGRGGVPRPDPDPISGPCPRGAHRRSEPACGGHSHPDSRTHAGAHAGAHTHAGADPCGL